jgi:hypothetical protein
MRGILNQVAYRLDIRVDFAIWLKVIIVLGSSLHIIRRRVITVDGNY